MPWILVRLWRRSKNYQDFKRQLKQRLGFYDLNFAFDKSIWIHSVSVGETLAAIPLVKKLMEEFPELPIIMTTMTVTGAERVKAAFGDKVTHLFIPYDLPDAVNRFLNVIRPKIAIIMETELWPNLIAACRAKRIPLSLINARLSEKSAKGYAKIASLTKEMLQSFNIIASQGYADSKRFIALGANKENVIVTGNIKFDLQLPEALKEKSERLRQELGQERYVWLAASTHEGEEEIILKAHQLLCEKIPNALLILVPRHPERFDAMYRLSSATFKCQRHSQHESIKPDTQVYLGDTMGELLLMYGACDIAFVAGSLIPKGGHNMLEPAALGKPIIMGTSLYNFAEISQMFLQANALTLIQNAEELGKLLIELGQNTQKQKQLGENALAVMKQNRGALSKQVGLLFKLLG